MARCFGTFLSIARSEFLCKSSIPSNSFSCYLSIRPFCYVLSGPISCSKIVLFPLHPVVDLFLCILRRNVVRIFFRYFGRSFFGFIAGPCLDTFCVSLFCQYLLIYFFLMYMSDLSVVFFFYSIVSLRCFHPKLSRFLSQFLYLSF